MWSSIISTKSKAHLKVLLLTIPALPVSNTLILHFVLKQVAFCSILMQSRCLVKPPAWLQSLRDLIGYSSRVGGLTSHVKEAGCSSSRLVLEIADFDLS